MLRWITDRLGKHLPRPRQALLIDPNGQVLVLNYARTMTTSEADKIKAHLRAEFPGLPVLLVCADNIAVKAQSPGG